MLPVDINNLIDNAIMELSSDDINDGAETLIELAMIWAKAGLAKESFFDIRQYIINEAIDKTEAMFIEEKLKIAERKMYEDRRFQH